MSAPPKDGFSGAPFFVVALAFALLAYVAYRALPALVFALGGP